MKARTQDVVSVTINVKIMDRLDLAGPAGERGGGGGESVDSGVSGCGVSGPGGRGGGAGAGCRSQTGSLCPPLLQSQRPHVPPRGGQQGDSL